MIATHEAKTEHDIEESLLDKTKLGRYIKTEIKTETGRRIARRFYGFDRLVGFLHKFHNDVQEGGLFESLFEYLDFAYTASDKDKRRVPAEGRAIVIANHPFGGLDSLSLLATLCEVRRDIHIVIQDPMMELVHLLYQENPASINADLTFTTPDTEDLWKDIGAALQNEKAVIFFPAVKVDTWTLRGIRQGKWEHEVFDLAAGMESPVIPAYIHGKNRFFFYLTRGLAPKLARRLLLRESLYPKYRNLNIKFGNLIPHHGFSALKKKARSRLMQKHLRSVGHDRKGYFKTEKNVIHPVNRKSLRDDILNCEVLGFTEDSKIILLTDYQSSPNIMEEIGRLREVTFRKIGEGTGYKRDLDSYDRDYKHLVLWDDKELEIVGAYRLGICKDIVPQKGIDALYSASLFEYSESFEKYFPNGIECGRSFVQQKYWNSMALDYLWHGIGAYIAQNPDLRYLFGPVSISQNYNMEARNMLIYFYLKWFGAHTPDQAKSKNPYRMSTAATAKLDNLFVGENYGQDFRILKQSLKPYGLTVPTLYKQYSELCETGGVQFIDFGIDADFNNCVDGLIVVDLEKLTPKKRGRYIETKLEGFNAPPSLLTYFQ